METLSEKAYAKLNISLDVGAKREDGFHEISTVMQSVCFCDNLTLTLTRSGGLGVSVNLHYLPCDDRNIAVKAAKAFFEHIGEKNPGLEIVINKRVPICAGLGGGSSDAAAVLRALNKLTKAGMPPRELEKLGERLGSDVPFCVSGGTVLATGRGEILTELPPFPDCVIVICKPPFAVSTPKLFDRLDSLPTKYHPDTAGMLRCIGESDLRGASQRMFNVFEELLPSGREQITNIKGVLLYAGAFGAAMSGTGSAVFGVFDNESLAKEAASQLRRQYSEVFITMPQEKINL